MKFERSNVEFAIWRKKVDKSLFEHNGTTVPEWACRMWGLQKIYGDITSTKDPRSDAAVIFRGKEYRAWVAMTPHRRNSAFRLWYTPDLSLELKRAFLMSYMRSLEGALGQNTEVEQAIAFWEFIDIEFDASRRLFKFVDHYRQKATFPNLFARLIGSPALRRVADEVEGKGKTRIYKQDWKARSELEFEIGAQNVIYMLLTVKKNSSTSERLPI